MPMRRLAWAAAFLLVLATGARAADDRVNGGFAGLDILALEAFEHARSLHHLGAASSMDYIMTVPPTIENSWCRANTRTSLWSA